MDKDDNIFDNLIKKLFSFVSKNSEIYLMLKGYLEKRYSKFSMIDTLVFPIKQTEFVKLYQPLTLFSTGKKYKLDDSNDFYHLLQGYQRIIIEDTAGMGKSTIIKKMFRLSIEKNINLSFIIELRHINKNNTIIQEIKNQVMNLGDSNLEPYIITNTITNILKNGSVLILFDGYDEISNDDRNFVTKNLHEFIDMYSGNFFVIASRSEPSLNSLGSFIKFNIQPLAEDEAYELLARYDYYSSKPISNLLINKLINDHDESINEYLKNPLLVSLLYKSFEYKKDIPLKKTLFYRQIFEALFEFHDLTKEGYYKREKYSKLHSDDFEKVLRYFAFLTAKENKVEYEMDYCLKVLQVILDKNPEINFKPSDFVNDLLETVPLFKKEGNYRKWAHKSLQDYFAAKFLYLDAKDDQEPILRIMYSHPRRDQFNNLFELFYELDTKSFERTLLYWHLKDFQSYANQHINLLEQIPLDLRKDRIGNMYDKYFKVLIFSLKDSKEISELKTHNEVSNKILYFENKYKTDKTDKRFNYNKFYILKNYNLDVIAVTYTELKDENTGLKKIINKYYPELIDGNYEIISMYEVDFLKETIFDKLSYSSNVILNSPEFFLMGNLLTNVEFVYKYDNVFNKITAIESNLDGNSNRYLLDFF